MRICPLALMSGNTYYCNSSCALSSDGECLLTAALKEYANEKLTPAVVTYPNEATGKDSHSDYWQNFAQPREAKASW